MKSVELWTYWTLPAASTKQQQQQPSTKHCGLMNASSLLTGTAGKIRLVNRVQSRCLRRIVLN